MLKNKLKIIRLQRSVDEERVITQKECAEFYKVNLRLYCEWESNKGRQPGTDSAWRILKKLESEKITDLFYECPAE